MESTKKSISKICLFASIPTTLAWIGLGVGISKSSIALEVFSIIFIVIGMLAMIVSTATCGTLGRLLRVAYKGGMAVVKFPSIIIIQWLFILIWLGLAAAVFVYTIMFGILIPAIPIGLSMRSKNREMDYYKFA